MEEIIKNTTAPANGTKTYEEIKLILNGKDMVQKYDLAYEELMKLDKEHCQNDCRYYSLYELLKRRFNPNPYCWEKKYEKLINAEKYFNITNKCVENYWDSDSLSDLANCYAAGVGTESDDSKLAEYYRAHLDKRNQDCPWELKASKHGTIQLDDEVISYILIYSSKDHCDWRDSYYNENLYIECYRDLTDSELEVIAKKFIIERNRRREISKGIEEVYKQNPHLGSQLSPLIYL